MKDGSCCCAPVLMISDVNRVQSSEQALGTYQRPFSGISLITRVNADHGGALLLNCILSAIINSTTEAYPLTNTVLPLL